MKIKSGGAILATLDLVIHMYAEQRAFHRVMLKAHSKPEDYDIALEFLSDEARTEMELVRAMLVQYSEISIDDLLNGNFDV